VHFTQLCISHNCVYVRRQLFKTSIWFKLSIQWNHKNSIPTELTNIQCFAALIFIINVSMLPYSFSSSFLRMFFRDCRGCVDSQISYLDRMQLSRSDTVGLFSWLQNPDLQSVYSITEKIKTVRNCSVNSFAFFTSENTNLM